MNELIEDIYRSKVVKGRSGRTYALDAAVDPDRGAFLLEIIRDHPDIRKTLEVGCAQGLSSLHICAGLQGRDGASHTIIDPFQTELWDSVGVGHLEKAGFNFFSLVEEKSEFGLPKILEANEGMFDLVFIDGWHTFDHTMLDAFYATRLLRKGGFLIIDDLSMPGVRRVVDFLRCYPCYSQYREILDPKGTPGWKRKVLSSLMGVVPGNFWETVLSPRLKRVLLEKHEPRMVALRKTSEDTRPWDWHDNTF